MSDAMGSFSDESVPWFQTGPDRSHEWDWSRLDLRVQRRIGTVLQAHDRGYIVVQRVTSEGVISQDFLRKWDELTRSGFLICEQPSDTDPRAC